ncbi:uncharacterized protein LOC124460455 [Drosophila willistoni]|uniref:uncharacterized protein LOC124460455 n=1 Tax=Drosophila willistoni TaxID=7260 RepID=UPI001F07EE26|nr:uncharacterized protein LOC124460455 [Drosophila willistoni]
MVEHVFVDSQSSSDSSLETVSSDGSQLSGSEQSSESSSELLDNCLPLTFNLKRGHKRKGQGHEKLIETKRFKKVLESCEESVQSPSYGGMEEACGMGGCDIKARLRPVKSEIEMETYVINGQRHRFVNILPENGQFV